MSKKLLLADDSITIQKVIGITFANEDYDLTVVDNGNSALEKARETRPDLVLADVFMPGKNGYELCSAIKGDPALGHIPVLLLTGTFEPFDEDKARTAGADSWIAKPFESQTLIDRVEQMLRAAPVAPAEPGPAIPVEQVDAAAATIPSVPAEAEPSAAAWEEPELAEPAGAAAVPPAEEDIWSSIAFDEEDLQPASPELEEEFLFEEEAFPEVPEPGAPSPSSVPAMPEAVPSREAVPVQEEGEPDWGDFDDEILSLDENDILEAEELIEDEGEDLVFATEEAEEPTLEEGLPSEDFIFEEAPAATAAADRLALENAFAEAPSSPVDEAAEEWEFPNEEEVAPVPLEESGSEDWGFDLAGEPAVVETGSAPPTPPEEAPSQAPKPGAEERIAALSEADLERVVEKMVGAVVERLAGRLLEKVAWEVVPDLAESMIREEIRKIKENIA